MGKTDDCWYGCAGGEADRRYIAELGSDSGFSAYGVSSDLVFGYYCSVFGVCSGVISCSVLCGVREYKNAVLCCNACSGFGACSGIFCGKLVGKHVGKIVGNLWKKFQEAVEKKVLHIKVGHLASFPRSGGKVLLGFYTGFDLCWRGVLHIFHRTYYNYYYYIRKVFRMVWNKWEFAKNRADF